MRALSFWPKSTWLGTVPVLKYQKIPWDGLPSGEYTRAIASHFNEEQTVSCR